VATSVLSALIIARALGADGRGVVVTFAILQMLASVTAGLGTGTAAYLLVGRDPRSQAAVLGGLALVSVIVLSTTGLIAVLAVEAGFTRRLGLGDGFWAVPLLACGAAAQYLVTALTQFGMAQTRTRYASVGFAIAPVLVLVGVAIAAVATSSSHAFIVATVFGWVASAAVLLVAASTRPRVGTTEVRALFRVGAPAALGDVTNALSYRLDALIVEILAGAKGVGVYTLAVQVLEPVWIMATAASSGMLVRYRQAGVSTWHDLTSRAAILVALASATAVAIVIILIPFVVRFVGKEFGESFGAGLALSPGIVAVSASKVLAAQQVASGRLWIGTMVATSSLVITTVLDFILIPVLGVVGAGMAASAGYLASLALWVIAHRFYDRRRDQIVKTPQYRGPRQ
jgi:O-antigen/teichoic acid export membrane protein